MTLSGRRRKAAYLALAVGLFLLVAGAFWRQFHPSGRSRFTSSMITGCNAFENADAAKAVHEFEQAVRGEPADPDARLDLANALLLAGQSERAISEATELLARNPNSAAALYIIGCANLRMGRAADALKALQQSEFIQGGIAAVSFQIGRAQQALGHWQDAAFAFNEAISLQPEHPAAHYALSQTLLRLNEEQAAREELQRHQQIVAQRPDLPSDPTFFEKCEHTRVRFPSVEPEQPDLPGIKVFFVDATSTALGSEAGSLRAPFALLTPPEGAFPGLFAARSDGSFQLLTNREGILRPQGGPLPGIPQAKYTACLVGALHKDRRDDVLVLSNHGARLFTPAEHPQEGMNDVTAASGLANLAADCGAFADVDFTGKLSLLAGGTAGARLFRNQGNAVFTELTKASGISSGKSPVHTICVDDWNGDDLPDVFVGSEGQPPQLFLNQHGGPFQSVANVPRRLTPVSDVHPPASSTPGAPAWPVGSVFAVGDLDNDFHNDLVIASSGKLEVIFNGPGQPISIPTGDFTVHHLALVDYDNDGWLDIVAAGNGLRVWRNLGVRGFKEVTHELGLDKIVTGAVDGLAAADLDGDGDTDLLISTAGHGLQYLRNEGGNANLQLKVRLIGRRSNVSGLGARVELLCKGWRAARTAAALPLEIGVGRRAVLDSFAVHWTDLVMNLGSVKVDPRTPIEVPELELPTGSCPYLYVWDGGHLRFVTDILGAAPAGLRISEERFVEADSDELVWLGTPATVQPRDGHYEVRITDELRELIYLDEVRLLSVDHPAGTEVHPLSKLVPGRPFPPAALATLGRQQPLLSASLDTGEDITGLLAQIDGKRVSPPRPRAPQLRGLAEPFSLTLDFGPLAVDRPLTLALTGWLRFGGGMANVAASHDPELPFPFPRLEVECADKLWRPVDVVVGAPAGKTKTILVDLAGKLPAGARRLRLTAGFELHWDRIALFERLPDERSSIRSLHPVVADLHWHGIGRYEPLPWSSPLTPMHDDLQSFAPWLSVPCGWCTRYGDVRDLVAGRDNAVAIMNCGDEVTFRFPADFPPPGTGLMRDFFLFSSGWDKDADYHVEAGLTVEPLPFHGMDDQRYGTQRGPLNSLNERYNTRWSGPLTLRKAPPAVSGQSER